MRPSVREPVFNIPRVVVAITAVLALIQAVTSLLLSDAQLGWVFATFAFVPLRLTDPAALGFAWPGGVAGDVWTFFTYALLHGSWMHLGMNVLWLVAFGAPLARRFGPLRFIGFSLVGAAAGAAAHLMLAPQSGAPLVGASAAIAAQMAAAARFQFAPGARLGGGYAMPDADFRRAMTIAQMLRNSRVLAFLGIWLVFNLVSGFLMAPAGVDASQIAWDAHLGGFVIGLLFFPIFDPLTWRG